MIHAAMRTAILIVPLLVTVTAIAGERQLDSHEYKLLLTPSLFAGNPSGKKVNGVWQEEIEQKLKGVHGLTVSGIAFSLEKTRRVLFRDTATNGKCFLIANGFILRERAKLANGKAKKPKATLKFRHADRTKAAAIDFDVEDKKFEEDVGLNISGPQRVKRVYSVSGKIKLRDGNASTLAKLRMLFPGFEKALAGVGDRNDTLATVSSLTITEYVFEGPVLNLGDVEAAASMTLWYDSGARGAREPVLAEFSFDYDRDGHGGAALKRADALAVTALEKIAPLMMAAGQAHTKTRFVYEHKNFCGNALPAR